MLSDNRMIPYQAELDLKRMKPGMVLCIKYQLWCMLQYAKERLFLLLDVGHQLVLMMILKT